MGQGRVSASSRWAGPRWLGWAMTRDPGGASGGRWCLDCCRAEQRSAGSPRAPGEARLATRRAGAPGDRRPPRPGGVAIARLCFSLKRSIGSEWGWKRRELGLRPDRICKQLRIRSSLGENRRKQSALQQQKLDRKSTIHPEPPALVNLRTSRGRTIHNESDMKTEEQFAEQSTKNTRSEKPSNLIPHDKKPTDLKTARERTIRRSTENTRGDQPSNLIPHDKDHADDP
jgi:hypothetical protein